MTRPGLGSRLTASLFPEDSAVGRDPAQWIEETFGDELWTKQREIAESVAVNRVTAVPSANGCGKTWLDARLSAWWIMSAPIGESIFVATAPVSRQVDSGFWAELRTCHARGGLPGVITRDEWRIADTLVGVAKTSTDYTDEARASAAWQGLHRRRVLVVVDEASGVRPWLYRSLPALMTGATARLLLTGNPLAPTGDFFEACKPGSGANVIRVNALESPNFTDEKVGPRLAEVLPSQAWLDEMRRDYGEASPAYMARVEGRFPPQSDDGLISADWIREAHEREFVEDDTTNDVPTLSADIARSGGDETVVVRLRAGRARVVHTARGHDLMRTTGEIAKRVRAEFAGEAEVVVDATGLGSGVVDRLREQGFGVDAFNGAERADDPARFANRRASSYWALREALGPVHSTSTPRTISWHRSYSRSAGRRTVAD